MRRTRRLLLLVILLILAVVGVTYHVRRGAEERSAPAPPKSLPGHISATADNWRWSHTEGNRRVVEIEARNFRQIKEPSRFELEGVELRFFQKDGKTFDKVRSAQANFDIEAKLLHSPGPVEITLAVPSDGSPKGRLLVIRSSGVTFESTTGKARTDQLATFTFDTAEGQAVGAAYDPASRELELNGEVQLNWRGRGPKPKPMRVETGHLLYKERESKVFLLPWSRLTRDALTLEAGMAEVTLKEGVIRVVEAREARGSDLLPRRRLDYQASLLVMRFDEDGQMEHLQGDGKARMTASSEAGRTEVGADRVDLEFDSSSQESALKKVDATGQAVVESIPATKPGAPRPATRVLRSDAVTLQMRPGGREIATIETHAPGQIDFLPSQPGERRRHLEASRMWIQYAANNEIESFRAVEVATRTEREAAKKTTSTALTWSKDLTAAFDPKTGQLVGMEQWPDFRYEEGDRRGRAERASLDAPRDVITLTGRARVSDPSGSADADRIVLDQKSGDFTAEGRVTSTRQPDRKGAGSAMLASDQPVQARANRMTASDNHRRVVYQGDAVLWQGASRLQADRIEIDRDKRTLAARGRVVSQFLDRAKGGKGGFVTVRAPEMTYSDEQRLAHYQGGAELVRPGMTVRGREIRAFLSDSKSDSSLDHALADGQVEIVQTTAVRKLTGSAEHAEYEDKEQRIVLTGGEPRLVDSNRGTTRGQRLTYYADRDHLIVEGAQGRPAVSRLKK
jgi:lipopolysaccharide export system protein LptA